MRKIWISLTDSSSIDRAIKELVAYKDEIRVKTQAFVERLMDSGIQTAMENEGEYAGMIVFSKDIDVSENGVKGVLIATDGEKIVKTWYASKKNAQQKKNARSYEISPLLMAEFGSGWYAEVLDKVSGVGQGTYPSPYGHATDPDGWYWYDEDAHKQHSYGESPSFPMHSALVAMAFDISRIGKEIFG